MRTIALVGSGQAGLLAAQDLGVGREQARQALGGEPRHPFVSAAPPS